LTRSGAVKILGRRGRAAGGDWPTEVAWYGLCAPGRVPRAWKRRWVLAAAGARTVASGREPGVAGMPGRRLGSKINRHNAPRAARQGGAIGAYALICR
jgi:hypothetical protein